MKKNKKSTALISVLIASSLLLTPTIQAKYRTWEEKFTLKGVGIEWADFRVNPYTWAYTSSFAKKYAMPEKWIDENLAGIEAVAYKYAAYTTPTCGINKDPKKCSWGMSSACVFDLFIDKKIKIPWTNQGSQGFKVITRETALSFLGNMPKNKGISNADFHFYRDEPNKKHTLAGGLTPLKFDSESLENLTHISVSATCSIPRYESNYKFIILNPEQKRFYSRKDIINPIHTMTIPASFMKRVASRRLDEFPDYEFERKLKLKAK